MFNLWGQFASWTLIIHIHRTNVFKCLVFEEPQASQIRSYLKVWLADGRCLCHVLSLKRQTKNNICLWFFPPFFFPSEMQLLCSFLLLKQCLLCHSANVQSKVRNDVLFSTLLSFIQYSLLLSSKGAGWICRWLNCENLYCEEPS